eukprot:8857146-Alexandrium_andersonii.AAC.1
MVFQRLESETRALEQERRARKRRRAARRALERAVRERFIRPIRPTSRCRAIGPGLITFSSPEVCWVTF